MIWLKVIRLVDLVLEATDKIFDSNVSKTKFFSNQLKMITNLYKSVEKILLYLLSIIGAIIYWFKTRNNASEENEELSIGDLSENSITTNIAGYGEDLFSVVMGGDYRITGVWNEDRTRYRTDKRKLKSLKSSMEEAESVYNENKTEENRLAYERAKRAYEDYANHRGVDLSANIGTKLYSPFAGKVVRVNNTLSDYGGGRSLTIQSSDGKYRVVFRHLSKILVNQGDEVSLGQLVAESGASGKGVERGYNPHLHLEIVDVASGRKIDPILFNNSVYKQSIGDESYQEPLGTSDNTVTIQSSLYGQISVSVTSSEVNITQEVINKAKRTFEGNHKTRTQTFLSDCDNMIKLFIRELGIKDFQAAGIVGNLIRESQLNPRAFNKSGGRGAQGIAQWRGTRIDNYIKKYGKQPKDDGNLNNQAMFVVSELLGSHKNCIKNIKPAKSLEKSADIVFGYYEFSAGVAEAVRAMNGTSYHRKNDGEYSIMLGRLYAKEAFLIYKSFREHANNILRERSYNTNYSDYINGQANNQCT